MRLIALSIVIMAGAIMASAGAIADGMPNTHVYSQLPTFGVLLVVGASALFVIEWWAGLKRVALANTKAVTPSASAR